MVPKHLRKSNEGLGGDQESLMTSLIELQGRIKTDKSILRQPIDTGVKGVKDLIKAVVGGTQELQEILLNECTIIYECKICRNLFRSLANFISHKRIYCIKNYSYFTDDTTKEETQLQDDAKLDSGIVKCNNELDVTEGKVWLTSDTIVPNNIKTEKNNCLKPERRIKISPVKMNRKCDIAKIADGLRQKTRREFLKPDDLPGPNFYPDIAERVMMRRSQQQKLTFQIDNLTNNCSNELYQSNRKSEPVVNEKVSSYNEAVLQENGKFRVTPQGMQLEDHENLENYKCTICETHFISKQTLSRHIQIHHKERICYPCPICRTFFPSPSSTYRHLSKDHHKTEQQIRRLRPKVLGKASKRKLVDGSQKVEEPAESKSYQRLDANGGVLCCNSCGKLFNRQAVLRVHLMSCKEKESANSRSCNSTAPNSSNLVLPHLDNGTGAPPAQPKSGILVRRDYCKKLSCNAMNFKSVVKKQIADNHSFKGHSLKRVNKWRTVLQKLQSRNGLEVSDKSIVKAEPKQD